MEDEALHAGVILRQKRVELGYSTTDISRLTGIRTAIIEAIETGAFDIMPLVYMRSFVRRYARAVGIDERELPPLIDSTARVSKPAGVMTITNPRPSSRSKEYTKLFLLVFAIAIAAVVGYFFVVSHSDTPGYTPPTATEEIPAETLRTGSTKGLWEYFGATPSDSIRVEVVATDTVWLSATLDGHRSEQITLRPGDRRQWHASQAIVISLGNAGGVELYRNGEKLPPLGRRGEAVRYAKITANDVILSTNSWARKRDSVLETLHHLSIEQPQHASPPSSTTQTQSAPSSKSSSSRSTTTPGERRRQELLRRAMQQRAITPVPPKAPLPTQHTEP